MWERIVSFAGQSVSIQCCHESLKKLVSFLYQDLFSSYKGVVRKKFYLDLGDDDGKVSLYMGSKELYYGASKTDLAIILMNETIHELIVNSKNGIAMHAAALSINDGGILIPGPSGAGKSTLTLWLADMGLNYLSDELVFFPEEKNLIYPFIRPIFLKTPSVPILSQMIKLDMEKVLKGPKGAMIPHRLVNENHVAITPRPEVVLFPDFQKDSRIKLKKLTGAQAGMSLMGCHVNARNINDHGFQQIVRLARKTRAYKLTYSSFDGLYDILKNILPLSQKKYCDD